MKKIKVQGTEKQLNRIRTRELANLAKTRIPQKSSILFVSPNPSSYMEFNFWAYPLMAEYSPSLDKAKTVRYDFIITYDKAKSGDFKMIDRRDVNDSSN